MKKLIVIALTLGLMGSSFADIQDPPANDYGPTRKFGRGVSNLFRLIANLFGRVVNLFGRIANVFGRAPDLWHVAGDAFCGEWILVCAGLDLPSTHLPLLVRFNVSTKAGSSSSSP